MPPCCPARAPGGSRQRVDGARDASHPPPKHAEERPMKIISINAGLGARVGMLEHAIA
jgi:hypothetical protein